MGNRQYNRKIRTEQFLRAQWNSVPVVDVPQPGQDHRGSLLSFVML